MPTSLPDDFPAINLCQFITSPMQPLHPPRYDHANNILKRVQILTLFTQFSPISCYLTPPRLKYFPQHFVLKHPQSMFFP
jgi:hypothetical protein